MRTGPEAGTETRVRPGDVAAIQAAAGTRLRVERVSDGSWIATANLAQGTRCLVLAVAPITGEMGWQDVMVLGPHGTMGWTVLSLRRIGAA